MQHSDIFLNFGAAVTREVMASLGSQMNSHTQLTALVESVDWTSSQSNARMRPANPSWVAADFWRQCARWRSCTPWRAKLAPKSPSAGFTARNSSSRLL